MNHPMLQRLEGFLAKIDGRKNEILDEAREGLAGLMEQDPTDPMPYSNAVGAIAARLGQLRDKVDNTWEEQIEPKMEDLPDAVQSAGEARYRSYVQALARTRELFEAKASADFYRNLWPIAQGLMNEPVNCTQCAGPLQLPDRFFEFAFRESGDRRVSGQVVEDALLLELHACRLGAGFQ